MRRHPGRRRAPLLPAVVGTVLAGALVAGPGPAPAPAAPPAAPAPPPALAAGAGAGADAGSVTVTGTAPDDCPVAFSCVTFVAECAGTGAAGAVPDLTGRMAIGKFQRPRRGTVVAFGGGGGGDYWLVGGGGRKVWKRLAREGLETVSVAWDVPWNEGAHGFAGLSCRSAAVLGWAAARDAAAGPPATAPGACGVCVIGYSVGTAQAASALAFHDLADEVDAVVAVSGPPNADTTAGCRRDGSPLEFLEPAENAMRRRIDDSLRPLDGPAPAPGPCAAAPTDLSMSPVWDANSLVPSGRLDFPATRFHFVWGSADRTGAVGQGIAHLAALHLAGTPLLAYDCLPAHHDVFASPEGVDAIAGAVLWVPGEGTNVPPVPDPGLSPRCPVTS